MSRSYKGLGAVAIVAALLCALPVRAIASSTEVSILMDDNQLIYSSREHQISTLERLKGLGVDVVKVSLVWSLVAPQPDSSNRPDFDATNPADYPPHAWDRYDRLVAEAQKLGMAVYFQLTPPAPRWAWARLPHNKGKTLGYAPDDKDFEQFVQAAGLRYSGDYPLTSTSTSTTQTSSTSSPTGGVTQTTSTSTSAGGASLTPITTQTTTTGSGGGASPQPFPRVTYWGIWNEPNFPSWLNPWRVTTHGNTVMTEPSLYRGIVNAAWQGLNSTGHGSDTIMLGETANFGNIEPIPFVEDLYCVDSSYQPLTGSAAQKVGCPASGSRERFISQNPGLFSITNYAHHPYGFNTPPDQAYSVKSWVTIDNLGWLERVLDDMLAGYGRAPGGGVPLYLTEWGYLTNPPNPESQTTPAEQAVWLDEGEYMTWRDPYVKAINQFLLVDDGPQTQYPKSNPLYWHTFTTGLFFRNGKPKPALAAWRIPIWIPDARHGPSVAVWGQLRPADHSVTQYGYVLFEPSHSTKWSQLAKLQTHNREGFVYSHVRIPAAGLVRIKWVSPQGQTFYSRSAPVT